MLVENGSSSVEAMQQGAQPRIPSISQALQKESAEGKHIKKKKKKLISKTFLQLHPLLCLYFFFFLSAQAVSPLLFFFLQAVTVAGKAL